MTPKGAGADPAPLAFSGSTRPPPHPHTGYRSVVMGGMERISDERRFEGRSGGRDELGMNTSLSPGAVAFRHDLHHELPGSPPEQSRE